MSTPPSSRKPAKAARPSRPDTSSRRIKRPARFASPPPGRADLLDLLRDSYKEVLDATKHQDDKIGRLFTGVSFLTAAALALANLGGSNYLAQKYTDWPQMPPALLFLATYLLLVVVTVMLLINSLATPLRVPGLVRDRDKDKTGIEWVAGVKASQIYFGEISKIGLEEWRLKWSGDKDSLERELQQSLVKETHNLAVRTQFKYGRTSEAIATFNFALLFLALTVILSATAGAAGNSRQSVPLPEIAKVALGGAIAVFVFIQLLSQVRYTRQTMDEVQGIANFVGGFLRYIWVFAASVWFFIVGAGLLQDPSSVNVLHWVAAAGMTSLGLGVLLQRIDRKVAFFQNLMQWFGTVVAVLVGSILTIFYSSYAWNREYDFSLKIALAGAAFLAVMSIMTPTLLQMRTTRQFRKRLRPDMSWLKALLLRARRREGPSNG